MLFACDYAWWKKYNGVPEFQGLKIGLDRDMLTQQWGIHHIKVKKGDDRLQFERGTVGWGGNSGFHCLNLAVQFQAKKIILVGFDMRVDLGVHWHGLHVGLNNPGVRNVERWRRCVDAAAKVISVLGIKVINVSKVSALQCYEKMTLEQALDYSPDKLGN